MISVTLSVIEDQERLTTRKLDHKGKCYVDTNKDDNEGVVMQHHPIGTGLFRDPLEVLGKFIKPHNKRVSVECPLSTYYDSKKKRDKHYPRSFGNLLYQ